MRKRVVGVVGGTGFDQFPEIEVREIVDIRTPYGKPSAPVLMGVYGGVDIAFLPRHGVDHSIPPHKIPYKANLYALKSVGAEMVVATCVAGSLKLEIAPGSVVIPDQFVHFTSGRDTDSVEADGSFLHLPMRDPYCATVRSAVIDSVPSCVHTVARGVVAVIQGPRFNTRAESEFLIRQGWDLVNMTQYPEGYFAKSLGLCYAVVATITDWDCGLHTEVEMRPEHMTKVLSIFKENVETTKRVLQGSILQLSRQECDCAKNTLLEYYRQS